MMDISDEDIQGFLDHVDRLREPPSMPCPRCGGRIVPGGTCPSCGSHWQSPLSTGMLQCACPCHRPIEQGGAAPGNCEHCRVLG